VPEGFFSKKGPIVYFPGVGQNIFAGGAKSGKITFSPLKTKERTSFAKKLMGNVKFQHPGETLVTPSDAHAPKTSYD